MSMFDKLCSLVYKVINGFLKVFTYSVVTRLDYQRRELKKMKGMAYPLNCQRNLRTNA